jgi:hypothetical protein
MESSLLREFLDAPSRRDLICMEIAFGIHGGHMQEAEGEMIRGTFV